MVAQVVCRRRGAVVVQRRLQRRRGEIGGAAEMAQFVVVAAAQRRRRRRGRRQMMRRRTPTPQPLVVMFLQFTSNRLRQFCAEKKMLSGITWRPFFFSRRMTTICFPLRVRQSMGVDSSTKVYESFLTAINAFLQSFFFFFSSERADLHMNSFLHP